MCTDGDPPEQLARAIDALVALAPDALAGGEAVRAVHRQLARLEAVATRACAAFERGGEWRADGARTATAWLAARCSLPDACARRRVQVGRDLPHLPEVERAWLAGDVGPSAAEVLVRARNDVTAAQLAADEVQLVRHARELHPRSFARLVAHWRQMADADGVEDEAVALHQRRRVHLSSSFEGAWFLEGVLDPVGGEIVATALGRVCEELFRSDWAEARHRFGDQATVEHLARSGSQRRADALVELARRATSVPAGSRRPRPLFTVHVDHGTLTGRICELARSRTVVTPGSLVDWLTEADIERVVFDGADRPLGVGPKRRAFSGADRRAVEVRDQECTHPLCDVPGEDCEVDHVVPFVEGGPTLVENGRLACGFHNRIRPGASRPERNEEVEREPP
jgi:hypothetical protein